MYPVIIFAVVLGLLRVLIGITVEPEPITWVGAYKAVAHLFMGGLFVAWLGQPVPYGRWMGATFGLLCLLELGVALWSRL